MLPDFVIGLWFVAHGRRCVYVRVSESAGVSDFFFLNQVASKDIRLIFNLCIEAGCFRNLNLKSEDPTRQVAVIIHHLRRRRTPSQRLISSPEDDQHRAVVCSELA